MFGRPLSQHTVSKSFEHFRKQIASLKRCLDMFVIKGPCNGTPQVTVTGGCSLLGCLTFISKHSDSDGEESTQHIEQSYGGLQRPFILTLGALGALLDPCVKRRPHDTIYFAACCTFFWSRKVLKGHVGRIWC